MGKIVLTAYISRGAPTSLVERTRIRDIYEALGRLLREQGVDAIVLSSPHHLSHGSFEVESREDIPCMRRKHPINPGLLATGIYVLQLALTETHFRSSILRVAVKFPALIR